MNVENFKKIVESEVKKECDRRMCQNCDNLQPEFNNSCALGVAIPEDFDEYTDLTFGCNLFCGRVLDRESGKLYKAKIRGSWTIARYEKWDEEGEGIYFIPGSEVPLTTEEFEHIDTEPINMPKED